jgi:hypothetical protein
MPVIKEMKATREVLNGCVTDETVDVAYYQKFVAGLETAYDWYAGMNYGIETTKLEWRPNFPFSDGSDIPCFTLRDEALYRSNHRVVTEDLDEHGIDYTYHVGTLRFDPNDTIGIARAAMWERDLDGYPVADEDDMSELEQELIEEAYDSYGKDDFFSELSQYEELDFLFDDDVCKIKQAYEEIFNDYLYRIASYSVSYSGEMYPSEDALKDALVEITYAAFVERPAWNSPINVYLDALGRMIREEKAIEDRKLHEQTNPPFKGIE